jgi:cytochrome c oxidase cbb3-type subunit 4
MEMYSTLSSIFTVVSFFVFVGVVWWAWSARRKASFDAAAVEPFALPDEIEHGGPALTERASRAVSNGARP